MREITYAQAIKEAMAMEMRRDNDVFLMGEDVGLYGGAFGVSAGMLEEFGTDRVRNTPISEAVVAGAAAGAAVTGMRPIAEIMFCDFATLAADQIINQAAKTRYIFGGQAKVPMVIRLPEGSGTGAAGHHSQSLEALFCHIPGLKVVAPSTPADAKGLLIASIRDDNPVMFFEQKLLYKEKGDVPEEDYCIPIGKSHIVQEGKELTIVTYGRMLKVCQEAAKMVENDDISIEIIDPRTLYPMDTKTIVDSVRKTGKLLIVHEACKTGGLGGEIAAFIAESEAFYCLKAPIRRLGGRDVPVPFSPKLEKNIVPMLDDIKKTIYDLCTEKNHRNLY